MPCHICTLVMYVLYVRMSESAILSYTWWFRIYFRTFYLVFIFTYLFLFLSFFVPENFYSTFPLEPVEFFFTILPSRCSTTRQRWYRIYLTTFPTVLFWIREPTFITFHSGRSVRSSFRHFTFKFSYRTKPTANVLNSRNRNDVPSTRFSQTSFVSSGVDTPIGEPTFTGIIVPTRSQLLISRSSVRKTHKFQTY